MKNRTKILLFFFFTFLIGITSQFVLGQTATITDPFTNETDVRTSANLIVLTVSNDTIIAAVDNDNTTARQFLTGFSGGSPSFDAMIGTLDASDILLNPDRTIATITVPAYNNYFIDENDSIQFVVGTDFLESGGTGISASGEIVILNEDPVVTITAETFSEAEIRQSAQNFTISLSGDEFAETLSANFRDQISSSGEWDSQIRPNLIITRTSSSTVSVEIPQTPGFDIATNETVQVSILSEDLKHTGSGTFTASNVKTISALPVSVNGSSTLDGEDEIDVRSNAHTITLNLLEDTWVADIGGNNTTNRSLVNSLTLDPADATAEAAIQNVILGTDNGAANTSINANQVTFSVPAIPGFDLESDVQFSFNVPANALQVSSSSVSTGNFARINYVAPSFTMTPEDDPLYESFLDGEVIRINLSEDAFENGLQKAGFTLVTSPSLSGLDIQTITRVNSQTVDLLLNYTGNTSVNVTLDLNISGTQLISGNAINGALSPAVIIAVIEPEIVSIAIPDEPMGIGDTVTAEIYVSNDQGSQFDSIHGTIAGRELINDSLNKQSNTLYYAYFIVDEDPLLQYAPGEDIPVSNVQMFNDTTPGNIYNSVINLSNPLDSERPVVSLVGFNNGSYRIGQSLTATIQSTETGLTFDPDLTSINNVPLSRLVSYEVGNGIYQLTYTVAEGDGDVDSPDAVPVRVVFLDQVNNTSLAATSYTGQNPIIDANSPEIISVQVINPGQKIPEDTLRLLVTADEAGYQLGTGSKINNVPVSDFTDQSDGTYTLEYIIGPDDASISAGGLTATIIFEDAAGNNTTRIDGISNDESLVISTDKPSGIIYGDNSICAGGTAYITVEIEGGEAPYNYGVRLGSGQVIPYSGQPAKQIISVSPTADETYTLVNLTDNLGIAGRLSGSADIVVNALPTVEIIEPTTETFLYDENPIPVHLKGSPSGGFFAGPGVETSKNLFHPDLAGIPDSPHIITYTYVDPSTGCENITGKQFFVVAQPAGIDDVPSRICYNQGPVEISGYSTTDPNPGKFKLMNKKGIEVAAGITDLGNNTAIINTSVLTNGYYDVYYEYMFDAITVAEVREEFQFYVFPEIEFLIRDTALCTNHSSMTLRTNLDALGGSYFFSGPGNTVTGDTIEGFEFDPGNAQPGISQVEYILSDELGICHDTAYLDLQVFDVPVPDFMPDRVCIPVDGGEIIYTNLTDKPSLVSEWTWNFTEGGTTFTRVSSDFEATVTDINSLPGQKRVELAITTVDGCTSFEEKVIELGDEPEADFRWDTDCFLDGIPTSFINTSATNRIFEDFKWNFYDKHLKLIDSLITATAEDTAYFQFSQIDRYYVELIAENNLGCKSVRYDTIFLKESVDFNDSNGRMMDFNINTDFWSPSTNLPGTNSTWVYGEPDFDGYDPLPGDKSWYTQMETSEKDKFNIWIQSTCFDLRKLERPMIRMDVMRSFDGNRDGAVLQYSLDNGINWSTVGNIDEGINWYNRFDIVNKPGGGKSGEGSSIGWSGDQFFNYDSTWVTVAHDLDDPDIYGKPNVIFGIFYATDNSSVINNEGIAVDNIYIGERRKNTVLEHFTNAGDDFSSAADDVVDLFDGLYDKDVVSLQYHVHYPGEDPMNENSPAPASSRTFYYGVNEIPFAILGGGGANSEYEYDFTHGFPSSTELKKITLEDPLFELMMTMELSAEDLRARVTARALRDLDSMNLALHVAIVEQEVTSYVGANGDNTFHNVVLDMLPSAAGTSISGSWKNLEEFTRHFTWAYKNVEDVDDLMLVAFLQEKSSRRILQALKVTDPMFPVNILQDAPGKLNIYPNPVRSDLHILHEMIPGGALIEVIDMTGRIIELVDVPPYEQETILNVVQLAAGTYSIAVKSDGRLVGRSRFMKID